jgi:hypothetical protein
MNLLVQCSRGDMKSEETPASVAEHQFYLLTSVNKLNFSAFWEHSSLEFQTSVT